MKLPHAVRVLPAMFRIGSAELVAYRAEMVIWILSATMPLIMLALWNRVVTEAPLEGFGPTEITRYFAATLVVRQITGSWLAWELNSMIRTGSLSPHLLRPMNPLLYQGVSMLSALPLRFVILVPMLAGLIAWRPELLAWPGLAAMGLFGCSVALAWLINLLTHAVFGMLAFWTEQSQGLFGAYFSAWMLLSGYIAPLSLFPGPVRTAIAWSPFRGMLAVPVELLAGLLGPREALWDLALQTTWAALLWGLAAAMWRVGVRRYGAYGA